MPALGLRKAFLHEQALATTALHHFGHGLSRIHAKASSNENQVLQFQLGVFIARAESFIGLAEALYEVERYRLRQCRRIGYDRDVVNRTQSHQGAAFGLRFRSLEQGSQRPACRPACAMLIGYPEATTDGSETSDGQAG